MIPTHDDLTLVVLGWPHEEFQTNRRDVERHYMEALELAPEFAERVRGARRKAPFRGAPVASFFRRPFGPGWALVGDAGYNKDPITALGICDAFRDAELCAVALDAWLSGTHPFDEAMGGYQVSIGTCTANTLSAKRLPARREPSYGSARRARSAMASRRSPSRAWRRRSARRFSRVRPS